MSPSKKKMAKPKEVSLEATPQAVTLKAELPNEENKLLDEDDDQATSSIGDLSTEPEEARNHPSLVSGIMPLTPFSNYPRFIQMAKACTNGFIIKT